MPTQWERLYIKSKALMMKKAKEAKYKSFTIWPYMSVCARRHVFGV